MFSALRGVPGCGGVYWLVRQRFSGGSGPLLFECVLLCRQRKDCSFHHGKDVMISTHRERNEVSNTLSKARRVDEVGSSEHELTQASFHTRDIDTCIT